MMTDTYTKCEDKCMTQGNIEKAMYYKWARAVSLLMDADIVIQ